MALEVLTDEGVKALASAAASGCRLVVEFAAVGNKSGISAPETVESYAALTAQEFSGWTGDGTGTDANQMPCVAMLPSAVSMGDSTTAPQNAIDCEFSWLPTQVTEFDTVAVFGRLYYGYAEYGVGTYVEGELHYVEGTVVWYRESSGTVQYYRCIADVDVTPETAAQSPSLDTAHWQAVSMTDVVITDVVADGEPPLRATSGAESLVLLHISTTDQKIKVAQGLEFNYKLRLLLNGTGFEDPQHCPVYLESLVPAGDAALQLGFLSQFAQSMRTMRECIAQAYGR